MYDPVILETTSKNVRETKTVEWEGWCTTWYTRRGALKAVCHNIRQELDEDYYDQLGVDLMGYKWVNIRDYFKHLDGILCTMDTRTIQKMTALFYKPLDHVIHITKFTRQLAKQ